MASISKWRNLLSLIGEVDIRPIRDEAARPLELTIVTSDLEAGQKFAQCLCRDPDRPEQQTGKPVQVTTLEKYKISTSPELIFLVLKRSELEAFYRNDTLQTWRSAGKRMIFVLDEAGFNDENRQTVVPTTGGSSVRFLFGRIDDMDFILENLIPAVLAILPDYQLALARRYPLFRGEVVRRLINDTSTSNAAYSLTTGLAEIIPILNIPLNVTDMIILTKAQAFLVYRLGLALGLPYEWRAYLAEFGGVLGGGFLWRQMARLLVGLIPGYGIIPKVAVAYSGTYVVGQAVYYWYLTGRHISKEQIQSLYGQVWQRGRLLAGSIFAQRMSLARFRRKKSIETPVELPEGTKSNKSRLFSWGSRSKGDKNKLNSCPVCARPNLGDDFTCRHCGAPLSIPPATY